MNLRMHRVKSITTERTVFEADDDRDKFITTDLVIKSDNSEIRITLFSYNEIKWVNNESL